MSVFHVPAYAIARVISALVLLSTCAVDAIAETSRRFTRERDEVTLYCDPEYVRLRLIREWFLSVEKNRSQVPVICAVDKAGVVERIAFRVPNVGYVVVYDVSATDDGALALAGIAVSDDSQLGEFVAWISPDRKNTQITHVSPFVPRKVAVATDGSLWTIGWVKNATDTAILQRNVLKSFDRTGKLLRTIVPNVQGKSGRPATAENSIFRTSSNRLSWYTSDNEYVEFSLDGIQEERFDGPPVTEKHSWALRTFAISPDGQAVVGVPRSEKWDVWQLDREARTWNPIEVSNGEIPKWGEILGFDNNTLVLSTRGAGERYDKALRYRRDPPTSK